MFVVARKCELFFGVKNVKDESRDDFIRGIILRNKLASVKYFLAVSRRWTLFRLHEDREINRISHHATKKSERRNARSNCFFKEKNAETDVNVNWASDKLFAWEPKLIHNIPTLWILACFGEIKNIRLAHSAEYMKQSSSVVVSSRRHTAFHRHLWAPPTGASSVTLKGRLRLVNR